MTAPLPWTALPTAAALLADCVQSPPEQRFVRGLFGPRDGEMEFVGSDLRVKALRRIHKREADRIFAECEKARDYDAYAAHCRLSVQAAIAQAIAASKVRRAAA